MNFIFSVNEIKTIEMLEKMPITHLMFSDKQFSSSKNYMSHDQMAEAVKLAHQKGYQCVGKVDRLYMETELTELIEYLKYLVEIKIDSILISDLGVKQIVTENSLPLKCIYAPETLLTNKYDIEVIKNDGFESCVISKDIIFDDMIQIADEIENFCYLRGYGPILISYSKRRFISIYLEKQEEYLDDYYLIESSRDNQKLPILEKETGSWLYGPTLICFDSLDRIKQSKVAGLILDGNLYTDSFNLEVAKLIFACYNNDISSQQASEKLKQLNTEIEYTSLSEIRKTGLDKA